MTINNKDIKVDDESGILTIKIEMTPVKLGREKKVSMYTQDVLDLLKESGYDVQSTLQHGVVSNFRTPHVSEWKFLLKNNIKKHLKLKKVEKQLEPTTEPDESVIKDP